MGENRHVLELHRDRFEPATPAAERDRLASDLQNKIERLNDQARIFIPLIAVCMIVSIPVWSKSPGRFLILLLNPFVLLPVGFCVVHLAAAYLRIVRARARIRDWDKGRGPQEV